MTHRDFQANALADALELIDTLRKEIESWRLRYGKESTADWVKSCYDEEMKLHGSCAHANVCDMPCGARAALTAKSVKTNPLTFDETLELLGGEEKEMPRDVGAMMTLFGQAVKLITKEGD